MEQTTQQVTYAQILKDLQDARNGKLQVPPSWFGKKVTVLKPEVAEEVRPVQVITST